MRKHSIYTLALIFFLQNLFAQQASLYRYLLSVDSIKPHDVAMRKLDSINATGNLNTKQQLEVNIRRLVRASLLQQFDKAIKVGTDGLFMAQKNKLDSMEGAFNEELGNANYYMEQLKKAAGYYRNAIAIARRHNYWYMEAACSNNIGALLTDLREYTEAEMYLRNSISLMEKNAKNHSAVNTTYRILATFYANQKKYNEAEAIYKQLIEKWKTRKDTSFVVGTLIYYGDLLKERGDTLRALSMSEEALALMRPRQHYDPHSLIAVLKSHSINLSHTKRYKEAHLVEREAFELLKKTYTEDLEKEISETETKYKTAQLKHEKEIIELTANRKQQIYLFSFTGILILLSAGVYIFNQRKSNRLKIAAQQHRLEAIIEGEEKERSRIAKDLHDGIVQNLTAIQLKIMASGNNDPATNLIYKELNSATKEVREIAYQMMPIALREYGLIKSLEDLLQKTLAPKDIKHDFETVNFEERLPEKIEVCLYRITQELLNNVIKHSKASFVSLVISKHHDSVSLIFEDNGTGFNHQEVKHGIGMKSLSSRLEIVNGELKFETSAGTGTMAIIKIPL